MERDARHLLTELLVLRAQAGDEQAFAELFGLWQRDFRRYAFAKVGDAVSGEEVAQSAWITIARGLSRVDDPACFPRWAFRIVERRAVDCIRRRQREREAQAAIEHHALVPPATSSAPRDDTLECVRECIAKLDTRTRELLSLFYETGLSVAEIAAVHDVPVGTIKSRLFHAREEIKRQIERTPL